MVTSSASRRLYSCLRNELPVSYEPPAQSNWTPTFPWFSRFRLAGCVASRASLNCSSGAAAQGMVSRKLPKRGTICVARSALNFSNCCPSRGQVSANRSPTARFRYLAFVSNFFCSWNGRGWLSTCSAAGTFGARSARYGTGVTSRLPRTTDLSRSWSCSKKNGTAVSTARARLLDPMKSSLMPLLLNQVKKDPPANFAEYLAQSVKEGSL
mmetsp:Transcript_76028/g.213156  ORF Transcript_76028/g.213156 Transcript_76028/m.213156 type:complete len:211 (-) Transcript_76028:761-1393(-)